MNFGKTNHLGLFASRLVPNGLLGRQGRHAVHNLAFLILAASLVECPAKPVLRGFQKVAS